MEMQKNICYLAHLPKDVQDMIAEYLPFKDRESDGEFIKRAMELYQLPAPLPLCYDLCEWPGFGTGSDGCIASYLIDRSKILLVERYYDNGPIPKVSIIDLKKKEKILQEDLKELVKEKMSSILYMTLSRDSKLISQLLTTETEEYTNGRIERIFYRLKLLITNRDNHEVKHVSLPDSFTKCEFNKQGTKIILLNNYKEMRYGIHRIVDQKEHATKSQKTLSEYLRQYVVCKDLKKSL